MTRAEACNILNLSAQATEAEIRRQYKKLAMKVHPDVNPDPRAHEKFILLTLAMERLMKMEEDEPASPVRTSRKTCPNETEEQRFERLKKAKERFEQQRILKQRENDAYFRSLTSGLRWKIYRGIMICALIMSCMMSLEWLLPHHFEKDTLLGCSKANHSGILQRNITAVELENRGTYFTHFNRGIWSMTYPEVTLETTWFLHTPLCMYNTDDFRNYRSDFDFHSGSIQAGLIGFFLIPLFTFWYRRKNLYFVFLYQLSFWVVGITVGYLLFTQFRLFHILTLGFI